MPFSVPRLVVAGLSGDGGKTLVSLGLGRAFADRGLAVQAFKKGPDYIDPAWLSAATRSSCRSLDSFLMPDEAIDASVAPAFGADFILVEGNRGLFDGVDAAGSHSTAELAKKLKAPVILVVDTTKMTRTVAAIVLGCRLLDPDLQLAGVILNRVGTPRQERVIREAVEKAAAIPVLGAIPRLAGADPLPGRHLGLVTFAEHSAREEAVERAARAVADAVDLEQVLQIAGRAGDLELSMPVQPLNRHAVTIGYFKDEIFSFYYPENLAALEAAGARLVTISPTVDAALPDQLDALYIGGGFPEVHAPRLAENQQFAADLRGKVAAGLPVYAECGGLMYLARELIVDGASYPMAGVLDLTIQQEKKPQGHGYEVGTVDRANPFFETRTELRGHEFHYSHIIAGEDLEHTVVDLERGVGTGNSRDCIVKSNVWASYLHVHAAATPQWADGLVDLAAHHAPVRSAAAWA